MIADTAAGAATLTTMSKYGYVFAVELIRKDGVWWRYHSHLKQAWSLESQSVGSRFSIQSTSLQINARPRCGAECTETQRPRHAFLNLPRCHQSEPYSLLASLLRSYVRAGELPIWTRGGVWVPGVPVTIVILDDFLQVIRVSHQPDGQTAC